MQGQAKTGHQIKALFIKNLHIQKRQPCTNCCQILTPIICLIFTILIRNVAIANIPTQSDTLYSVFPLISVKFNDYSIADQLSDYISRDKVQWYLYDYEKKEDRDFIGIHDGYMTNYGMLGQIRPTINYYSYHNVSIEQPYYEDYRRSPVFKPSNRSIDDELFKRYQFLNDDTFYSLRSTSSPQHLPDGAIYFQSANRTHLQAVIRVKDVREFLFYRPNGICEINMKIDLNSTHYNHYYIIAEGFLSIMSMITEAYIKQITGETVISGYTYMPVTEEGSVFIDMLINTVATIIFPLSLSLLLPVFLYLLVLQKEEKLIQMMRMNGMSMLNYWSINFLYNLIISLLTNIVFCLFGYFFLDSSFFHQTSFAVLAIILLGWMLSQIGMSMLFQVFLSGSRAANIIGYLVSIWTNLIGATLSIALFQYPNELPVSFSLWPTFSFNRLFYLMFTYCSMDKCIANMDSVTSEMWRCIAVLYGSWVLFSLIGMYLFEVIPQQYGVSRPILFPLSFLLDIFKKPQNLINADGRSGGEQTFNDHSIDEQIGRINEITNLSQYPLVCSGLTKRYKSGKLAVNNFNLLIEDKTIFGLLGPNGAGKTSLLSMITGIFSPTKGIAYVGGYSILNEIHQVHLEMGVCPQFDIVWPTLTVEEHLYFYARLRGVSGKEEKQKVEETLVEVNLTVQRNSKVTELSGGMKRRLSIGISLVGDPRIVFMDEPTSGLDPQNRRHLWQVLTKCRQKRSLFITTHLMEQAESLCDKIGIITNGTIRTVGDLFQLKEVYGRGYFISVSVELEKNNIYQNLNRSLNRDEGESDSTPEYREDSVVTEKEEMIADSYRTNRQKIAILREKLLQMFHPATVCKQISGFIKINVASADVSAILLNLKLLKQQNINFEWAISDSNLQDVFLQVINRFDPRDKQSLLESLV